MCHQRKAGINLWLAHLPKAGTGKRQPFSPGTVASPGYLFYLPQHICPPLEIGAIPSMLESLHPGQLIRHRLSVNTAAMSLVPTTSF